MDNDQKNHKESNEKFTLGAVKEEIKDVLPNAYDHAFYDRKQDLDIVYSNDRNMNNDQNNHKQSDEKFKLRPVKYESPKADDHAFMDLQYDEEVNRLLDEVNEEFFFEYSETLEEEQDDSEDNYNVEPNIPDRYQEVLRHKIEQANEILEKLSKKVYDTCPSARDHLRRIKQDYSTNFCKMDYPRHPPWNKPWYNHWKFKSDTKFKCEKSNDPIHFHTDKCKIVTILKPVSAEHFGICQAGYPKHVTEAVEFFQAFAKQLHEKFPISSSTEASNTIAERHIWNSIKLEVKSNYLNKTAISIRGDRISIIIPHLEIFYRRYHEKISNAIDIICCDTSWMKQNVTERLPSMPVVITGDLFLKDKVGPISIQHDLLRSFESDSVPLNPVEINQLSEAIQDYTGLTKETKLLYIGCDSGLVCLTMAHKCGKIIGLSTEDVSDAEDLKKYNNICNVSFIQCASKKVLSTCSPLISRCAAVAVLNLSSDYGRCGYVMQALRNIQSIWRVFIYGSFFGIFHNNISRLISEDKSMGERYIPMQGCILDKSPPIKKAYDIVIVFERKSLVQPAIELLTPGPTLNVKVNSLNSKVDCKSQTSKALADNNKVGDTDISPKSENSHNTDTRDQNSEDISDKIKRFTPTLEKVVTAEGFEFSIATNATFFSLKVNETPRETRNDIKFRVKHAQELMDVEWLDKQIEEYILVARKRMLIQNYLREKEEGLKKDKTS